MSQQEQHRQMQEKFEAMLLEDSKLNPNANSQIPTPKVKKSSSQKSLSNSQGLPGSSINKATAPPALQIPVSKNISRNSSSSLLTDLLSPTQKSKNIYGGEQAKSPKGRKKTFKGFIKSVQSPRRSKKFDQKKIVLQSDLLLEDDYDENSLHDDSAFILSPKASGRKTTKQPPIRSRSMSFSKNSILQTENSSDDALSAPEDNSRVIISNSVPDNGCESQIEYEPEDPSD